MSGECKSYRLNDPMTWLEFISMPDDLKVTYIKLLRQKFNVPDKNIAEMFGVCKDHVCRTFKNLGLQRTVRTSHPKWDKEGFYAWVNGMDKLPTPVLEEEPVEEPVQEEPEVFVEDDLPCEEKDSISTFVPVEHCMELDAQNTALKAQIDELEKKVDELLSINAKLVVERKELSDKCQYWQLRCDELDAERNILEKQMDVVRMIFGGGNRG